MKVEVKSKRELGLLDSEVPEGMTLCLIDDDAKKALIQAMKDEAVFLVESKKYESATQVLLAITDLQYGHS